ncbi:MAG: hypothetical protein AMXMBFR59_32700 [Rhodanobacteraceae bacterium]
MQVEDHTGETVTDDARFRAAGELGSDHGVGTDQAASIVANVGPATPRIRRVGNGAPMRAGYALIPPMLGA